MSAPKHTPGPWIFDEIPTSCGRCFRIGSPEIIANHEASKSKGSRTLPAYGCVYDDWGRGETENKANARLMAAAPELLDFLKEFSAEDSQCDVEKFRKLKIAARVAIAKAEASP